MKVKLIIDLDNLSQAYAIELAKILRDEVWGFRTRTLLLQYGSRFIYDLRSFGNVLADIQLLDDQNSIQRILKIFKSNGSSLVTVNMLSNYCPPPAFRSLVVGFISPVKNDNFEYYISFAENNFYQAVVSQKYFKRTNVEWISDVIEAGQQELPDFFIMKGIAASSNPLLAIKEFKEKIASNGCQISTS